MNKRHQGSKGSRLARNEDLLEWSDEGYVISRPQKGGEGTGTDLLESPGAFKRAELFYLVFTQCRGMRYTVSSDPREFSAGPVRRFEKWPYGFSSFEMADVDTGLFAYAGPAGFFRNLRFGYVDFKKKQMLMRLCWRVQEEHKLFFGRDQEQQ